MTQIDIGERGRITVSQEVVQATPSDFWASADCKVARSAGDAEWTLEAGDSVGVARIVTSIGDVVLRIRPKLDTADTFFLADYAYEQRHDPLRLLQNDVGLEAVRRDPTACLLVWHARSIRRFAARWLRRDYRTVDLDLDGKVKGRILVSRYLSRLANCEAGTVPCRVQERTQDTANNRVLKAGLRFIVSASGSLAVPAARRAVMREAKAALPLFAQVSDAPASQQLIRATTSRGPQRHYQSVLAATISMLRGELMGGEPGPTTNTTAFMWRMPVLFQEAVRGVMSSSPGLEVAPQSSGVTRIYDSEGRQRSRRSCVDPDLVLNLPGGNTLLVDTKYKDAVPGRHEVNTFAVNRHPFKVSRDDIYQIVAYTHHDKWPGSRGALLYPIVLAAAEPLPEPCRITGFGEPVWLFFIDVGPHAAVTLDAFVSTVRGLAATIPAAV